MFALYRIGTALLFYSTLPLSLLFVALTGRHREGLLQRFAFYKMPGIPLKSDKTIWVHAASVGEVQAAKAIITEVEKQQPDSHIILTTMTLTGRKVAESQFSSNVVCFLAPLDIPGIVERAIRKLQPDMYICVETELWPVLINRLAAKDVRISMVNGRISDRSYKKYLKTAKILSALLAKFHRIAVITEADRKKYISLGAIADRVKVTGNVKYDLDIIESGDGAILKYRNILNVDDEEIFIAGSTHGDEETELLQLYDTLLEGKDTVFVIAPRHIERISSIERIVRTKRLPYQLFSRLKDGREVRKCSLILIDTLGELAQLYGVAEFVFCGGSLVNKGGHNLMEAAVWNKAVFYGKYIADFQDAAELLESVGGGFRVLDCEELGRRILHFRANPDVYKVACDHAGKVARAQQGCSARQVAYIMELPEQAG